MTTIWEMTCFDVTFRPLYARMLTRGSDMMTEGNEAKYWQAPISSSHASEASWWHQDQEIGRASCREREDEMDIEALFTLDIASVVVMTTSFDAGMEVVSTLTIFMRRCDFLLLKYDHNMGNDVF